MYDRFRRQLVYLRVSVTDACNLRCTYCTPEVPDCPRRRAALLSFDEIVDMVREAVALGMHKIRLTGGEPLLRPGIVKLVAMLARVPGVRDFAMTTNGTLLADLAWGLRRAGLHRLNISLDATDPARFRAVSGGGDIARVLAGIDAALAAGFTRTKLNCVVESSADEPDARDVAAYARPRQLEVRFIRRMDLRAGRFWRVLGGEGGNCSGCNRLRVTSDGRVFPCLFSNVSLSIRELGTGRALCLAAESKPKAGTTSTQRFQSMGG